MSAIGQTIRRLREERGWTQAELGQRVGIDGTNIARREIGQTRVRGNERALFAKAFGMSLADFDQQWRNWNVSRTRGAPGIPVINRAPAGEAVDYEEYGVDSGQGYDYLEQGDIRDDLAFAVVVVGNSMQPRLNEGDCIILSPCDPYRDDGRLEQGKIVFVRFSEDAGGGCTLARFYIEDEQRLRLQKDNPAYAPVVCERVAVQSMAVAVERREKL